MSEEEERQEREETPTPWNQLTPLLAVSLSDTTNSDIILPFLYEMIDRFGIAKNPKDIGFYASILFMSSSLCQAITILQWGRLSDRIGRKPVLCICLAGTLIATLVLGVAPTFWTALLARSFNGFMTGDVVIVLSSLAEISDDTNRSRIMAILPLAWSFGSLFGAGIGGVLANPALQYPNLFGGVKLFAKFPYLLACLVGSVTTVLGLLSTMYRFKETLVKRNTNTEDMPLVREPQQQQQQQKPVKELLTPTITKLIITNVLTCLALVMYNQIYPIFAATPAIDGGLGLDSRSIGISLAIAGAATIYLQLVVYPQRAQKYGPLVCYQQGLKAIIIYLLSTPFLSILASKISEGNMEFYLMWILLIVLLLTRMVGQVLTLTSMNLLLANLAPYRDELGAINGIQQLALSITKVAGSLLSGVMWSWSIKHDFAYPFNYHLVWVVCAVSSSIPLYMTYQFPVSVNRFLADTERC